MVHWDTLLQINPHYLSYPSLPGESPESSFHYLQQEHQDSDDQSHHPMITFSNFSRRPLPFFIFTRYNFAAIRVSMPIIVLQLYLSNSPLFTNHDTRVREHSFIANLLGQSSITLIFPVWNHLLRELNVIILSLLNTTLLQPSTN